MELMLTALNTRRGFSWACVVSSFESDGMRVKELGSACVRERNLVFLSCVSLAFCLIICMYSFVHSSVIYNVIVTSVYTPCIYTFYKYIYENIWTIHHDQCLLKVLMYIMALFLLLFYHLDGFKLWSFGRNQPVLVRKLSWDWMSITGWR